MHPVGIHSPVNQKRSTSRVTSPVARPSDQFVSRNITPRDNGLPAGRTLDEFKELMHHGTDFRNPGRILQVMPWPVYGKMSDRELAAIYEFLRAIPSISPRPAFCQPPPMPMP